MEGNWRLILELGGVAGGVGGERNVCVSGCLSGWYREAIAACVRESRISPTADFQILLVERNLTCRDCEDAFARCEPLGSNFHPSK